MIRFAKYAAVFADVNKCNLSLLSYKQWKLMQNIFLKSINKKLNFRTCHQLWMYDPKKLPMNLPVSCVSQGMRKKADFMCCCIDPRRLMRQNLQTSMSLTEAENLPTL